MKVLPGRLDWRRARGWWIAAGVSGLLWLSALGQEVDQPSAQSAEAIDLFALLTIVLVIVAVWRSRGSAASRGADTPGAPTTATPAGTKPRASAAGSASAGLSERISRLNDRQRVAWAVAGLLVILGVGMILWPLPNSEWTLSSGLTVTEDCGTAVTPGDGPTCESAASKQTQRALVVLAAGAAVGYGGTRIFADSDPSTGQ